MGMQNDTATIKIVWQLSIEINSHHLVYYLASALLGIYHREVKTHIYTKICAQMFIETLFVIALTWRQPKSHLIGKFHDF